MSEELITTNSKEILLVGTAHVSPSSVEEVKEAISRFKPETIGIELCQKRYGVLKDPQPWKDTDIFKVIKEKKTSFLFANLVIASFQKRIGDRLGVRPGAEMSVAVEEAQKLGIPVALLDRDIQTTMKRLWRMLSLKERLRLFWALASTMFSADEVGEDEIERLKQTDIISLAVEEMAEKAPAVKRVLLDERDEYMAKKISDINSNKVLAVVGAGHVKGIRERLQDIPDSIEHLDYVPPMGRPILKYLIPLVITVIIALGFFSGGKEKGYEMMKWWLLSNAFFAALGSGLALAHPFSILTAAIASPITSLNPTLAAGWFAGLTEAYLRKPKVSDFESLKDDISSIKGFWKNPITRILMVVIFANIGSALGALVAMPVLARIILKG